MQKIILFEKDARDRIKKGIDVATELVAKTLGPNGKPILIKRSYISNQGHGLQHLPTQASKDGIGVLRTIVLDDSIANMGVDLCKEASEKTMSSTGDSTTTTLILLQALVELGLKAVDNGANPIDIKAGIDSGVAKIVKELEDMATPVGDNIETIRHIATVSANNDSFIGDLIAEAFSQIGKDGIIDLEISNTAKTEIKISDGVKFARGWVSPYFITNHAKNECELKEPFILLYDKKLTQLKPLMGILEQVMQQRRPLLIICDDADGEALASLASTSADTSKPFSCCIVKCPEFGDAKREAMEDLAIVTGGVYISDEKGSGLTSATLAMLGTASKVIVGKEETIIVQGGHKEKQLEKLIVDLKISLAQAEGVEREKIEKRIASLTGGVAVLSVGAPTEVEMKERLERCDDAIRATKAAISEGFVAGGGTAFVRCFQNVGLTVNGDDFSTGEKCVYDAILFPIQQICINAKADHYAILEEVKAYTGSQGYNAKTKQYEDLIQSGIIDAKKSLRVALENAASVAGIVITSGGLNCDSF